MAAKANREGPLEDKPGKEKDVMEQTFNVLVCLLIFWGFLLFLSVGYALEEMALYGLKRMKRRRNDEISMQRLSGKDRTAQLSASLSAVHRLSSGAESCPGNPEKRKAG